MRIKTIKIKLYKFDELSEKAKQKAINDEIDCIIETYDEDTASENLIRAVKKADEMQTPWFTGEYIWYYCKDEVLELLKDQGVEFTEDGKMYY